ncbi:MAG: histidine phosphatase family protein [Arcobacteraceae bacterium]|nr:histidine phosphatase family protein [Arcobacteraceae bacterium]
MKKLYLIRHSKSSWDNPNLSDYDRPLNNRGKKDRYSMAHFLSANNIHPDIVLCSPSIRTIKSLKAYKKILNISAKNIYLKQELYETTYDKLLMYINTTDNTYSNLFLIAHNPTLNDLVNYFIRDFTENIPTSGIVGLEFDCDSWEKISKTNCNMFLFAYPKLFEQSID